MQIEAILKPFQRFGVHLGLKRIHTLLAALGNPQQKFPIIHVAGTNGKGSVCAYLSATLTAAGYKTGRYTSPHLIDWNERICINEQQITAADLSQVLTQVKKATSTLSIANHDESPTQFEVITAAAWLYFAQQAVDIAVIEVGLGGRLDATNVVEQPLVTVITSISREHWQQLGPTVADIAREKAGILKPGCPAVIGNLPADAHQVVMKKAKELNIPVFSPPAAVLLNNDSISRNQNPSSISAQISSHSKHISEPIGVNQVQVKSLFSSQLIEYPLVLNGQIQLNNSALAVGVLEILKNQGWQKINPATIRAGMEKAKWPGRMQWIDWTNCDRTITKNILVDGAHNPGAAKVLRDYIDSLNLTPITWVMGMLSTKEHQDIFQNLLRSHDKLYLVPVPDHSSAKPEDLQQLALQVCPDLDSCQTHPDFTSALNQACQDTNLIVFCGSLYLIGNFFKSNQ